MRDNHRLTRAIWKAHNGHIPPGAVIHHKDKDTANNDINNLELITSNSAHIRKYHSPYKYKESMIKEITPQEYEFIKDRLPLKALSLLQ